MRGTFQILLLPCLMFSPQGTDDKAFVGGNTYRGVEVAIDLPLKQHVKNIARPPGPNGLGCCVFATLDMCARWTNQEELIGIIEKIEKGGGWPEKVDRVIKQFAPSTVYVQYEGSDPAFLDRAIQSGRPCGVTYGYGERYGNETIPHMVLLVHLDANLAAVVDNNYPGTFEWMSRDEFLKRWKHPSNKGWAYALLGPPPPPPPHN